MIFFPLVERWQCGLKAAFENRMPFSRPSKRDHGQPKVLYRLASVWPGPLVLG